MDELSQIGSSAMAPLRRAHPGPGPHTRKLTPWTRREEEAIQAWRAYVQGMRFRKGSQGCARLTGNSVSESVIDTNMEPPSPAPPTPSLSHTEQNVTNKGLSIYALGIKKVSLSLCWYRRSSWNQTDFRTGVEFQRLTFVQQSTFVQKSTFGG